MNVVITGGVGFLGQLLIAEILKRTVLPDAQGSVQKIDGIIALFRVTGRLHIPDPDCNPGRLSERSVVHAAAGSSQACRRQAII